MRLIRQPSGLVKVPMMLVVGMPMLVLQTLMRVLVLMCSRRVEVDADRHEHARDNQLRRNWLLKHEHRERRTDDRGARKVGGGTSRAEMAQREYEENQARAVAKKANDSGAGQGRRRQRRSTEQGERNIDRAGDEALDRRDLHRVARAQLAGQVVV